MNAELTHLATEITEHLAAALRHHRLGLEAYRAAGEKLIAAQDTVYAINGGRKGFGAWIKQQPSLPTCAQCLKYMRLARNWKLVENANDLTLSAAIQRIDTAEGKTKATDADEDSEQDSQPIVPRGDTEAIGKGQIKAGKPKRTKRLNDRCCYSPRLEGAVWAVQLEKQPDESAVLTLPLKAADLMVTTYLHLTKDQATQLRTLLA